MPRNDETSPSLPHVFKVTEITRQIKSLLENSFGQVWVEGELSNLRKPSSGHIYFTLKDSDSQIAAVMFRGRCESLDFTPSDGSMVRVFGRITVFEPRGNYQILVERMEPGGKGALQARFEELKQKLLAEGLFDESRKKPLPQLPHRVGIVTSATGAAVRDILNVLQRRFQNLHVIVAPVPVQGAGCEARIARALRWFNEGSPASLRPDVIIVGRGGGSMEDLWCFNEEVVARAVSDSEIPVISAVGHEIDFTICDFVADVRAPTPSAAAELVVGRKDAYEQQLAQCMTAMRSHLRHYLENARSRADRVAAHYVFREPQNMVHSLTQRLDTVDMRMSGVLDGYRQRVRSRVETLAGRLAQSISRPGELADQQISSLAGRMDQAAISQFTVQQRRLGALSKQLQVLGPASVLSRGFSLTRDADGRVVRSVDDICDGDVLTTQLNRGVFVSRVEEKVIGGAENE